MKKKLLIPKLCILLTLLFSSTLFGQITPGIPPEGIIYQAEARQADGKLLTNKELQVRIEILQDYPEGTLVWQEDYVVYTDKYGLFNLVIGEASSSTYIFADIDWAHYAHFLKVQLYDGKTWVNLGTTQFLSVPYAMHAKSASSAFEEDPVFKNYPAYSITLSNINEWNNAYDWGDHSQAGYLKNELDADPENELQNWSNLPGIPADIADGDDVIDDDADPENELQDWSTLPGIPEDIADGDDVIDDDADPANELQDISLSGTSLSLSMGSTIDLGELPDEVNDADADPTNEIQDLHLDGNSLTITMNSSATEIDLGTYLDDTDTHLTEAEVDAMVDNNGYLTEASDDQTLLLSGYELSIEDGNSVTLPDEVNDADPDPTNELISGFILNGNSVELSDAGGTRTIDLGSLEGDFSDGGDAAGSDRTLGNTSDHAISLLTNNANRLHIKNTGEIGIGTTIPGEMLEVAGRVYSTTGGFKFPDGTVQLTASTGGGGASEIDDLSDGKTGGYSVYLGANAGANDDRTGYLFNAAIGNDALSAITTGTLNTAMGYAALKSDTEGKFNVGIGSQALMYDTEGNYNVGIGSRAMENNTTGNNNVSIGTEANFWNEEGSQNTIIGYGAGHGNNRHSKSGNVFLGYHAGFAETGSNLLYIENSSSSSPLIWGDFSQNKIKINGSMEVTSSFKAWQIQLASGAHNGYVLTSDANGNGSWQSFASSPWTVSGYDIYRFSGNVGIGTNQPSFRLDVNGNIRVDGSVRANKLLIPATEQYYSIAGCTFNPTTSYSDARSVNYIAINPNTAWGDADLVAPVHIPSGATLENISALVLDNGPATITVSLYVIAYNGGKFNLGSTNSSINSSSPQNLSGSLSSTIDNNNNAYVAVVRCYGTYNISEFYRIYKVKISYSISALP